MEMDSNGWITSLEAGDCLRAYELLKESGCVVFRMRHRDGRKFMRYARGQKKDRNLSKEMRVKYKGRKLNRILKLWIAVQIIFKITFRALPSAVAIFTNRYLSEVMMVHDFAGKRVQGVELMELEGANAMCLVEIRASGGSERPGT